MELVNKILYTIPSIFFNLAIFEGTAALCDSPAWNGKIFARVILEMNPSLNWSEVVARFDSNHFSVRDRNALIILTAVLNTVFTPKVSVKIEISKKLIGFSKILYFKLHFERFSLRLRTNTKLRKKLLDR